MSEDSNVMDASIGDGGFDGRIGDLLIERELQDSYLTYAMSTIMDRALPDVRDGLKPSQRRILVAMNDLNLGARAKHRKCAKICGDVSGNYHPHGEAVIYPTLARYAQDWVMRQMLVDKQGNFGSIDGDPPAAMRYTEARMTDAASAMLDDLKLDTVDFRSNYDDTRLEPTVLPSRFPNLLVNGSTGIAVGMSCSMPPHNTAEVCLAIEAVIERPDITLPELMEIIPGPDFPTGGRICGRAGIYQAYSTGRGRVTVRGKLHTEETKSGRTQLVIDEIPYHLVQNALIDKITESVKDGRITDVSAIRNESGRKSRTRIVLELKRGAEPEVVENQLYRFTPLSSTVSIINIALVNHQPRTLTLRQLIDCFIDHRIEVIERRTAHLLKEAQKKAHILEGLVLAVCDISEVIKLIRESKTRPEAIDRLIARRFQIAEDHPFAPHIPALFLDRASVAGGIGLTRVQAEAIGRLQLIQLVGLEIEKLTRDYTALVEEIIEYERILSDRQIVLDMIKADTVEIRTRFGDERRTEIIESAEDFDAADLITEEDMVVTISHSGYIKRTPAATYREQGRGGRGVLGSDTKESDFIEHLFVASTHDDLLCLTNTGRMFKMKVYEIPQMSRTSLGRAIVNLLELREGERICGFMPIHDFEVSEDYLLFATARGTVKRTALKEYRNINRSGIIAINLREGDALIDMVWTTGDDDVLLATKDGMAIRFNESDVRVMGRSAAGVRGIALSNDDEVIGLVKAVDDQDLLTVTENGYGKRTSMLEYSVKQEDGTYRTQGRGGKGRRDIRASKRNGPSVAILSVTDDDGVLCVTQDGMIVRIAAESISQIGRNTQGVRIANLRAGDKLIGVARVVDNEDEVAESAALSGPGDASQEQATSEDQT